MIDAEIAEALGGAKKTSGGWLARCCIHEDLDPSLSLRDGDDGTLLVHCFAGCDPIDILRELRRRGLLDDRPEPRDERRPPKPAAKTARAPSDNLGHARTIWREAQSARGTLVETYCATRDLELPPGDDLDDWLRFHPRLRHPTGIWLPGIVCLVRDPVRSRN